MYAPVGEEGSALAAGVGLWTQRPRISRCQQPARIRIQWQLPDGLSAAAYHIVYIPMQFPLPFILLSQRGEQDEAIGAVCACMSAVFSVRDDPWGQPRVHVYMHWVYVCVYLPGIHAEIRYWLDLGA